MKSIQLVLLIILSQLLNSQAWAEVPVFVHPDIALIRISDQVLVHQTYSTSEVYGRFSSNGMLLISKQKALMIDTPISPEHTAIIYKYLRDSMNVEITTFIGGHSHDDCIGGMAYLQQQGVYTILGAGTKRLCQQLNLPLPDTTFEETLSFPFEEQNIECYFPGGGHTPDNIVVFIPQESLLFGGCLIKAAEARGLGNTADAEITSWKSSVERVQEKYGNAKWVIPGHGQVGDSSLLKHTIKLVEEHLGRN
ncbi:subclass B1 metallo-beta-lactamase [Roseimarinus sediminis]|uniref:subclass B1 metallo-beta-lactamase n=1 Tax=Roseimarinus sediminis TaxID=1610899 RepID=UPI003D22D286